MTAFKRATSEDEKHQREAKIIEAAQRLMLHKHFIDINMSEVAQHAGLAKGTVYLYFGTKEDLFLSLFERALAAWFAAFSAALDATTQGDTDAVIAWMVESMVQRPELTRLLALAAVLFEHNISVERARENKLWLFAQLAAHGALLEARLGLAEGGGARLLLRFYVIIAGLDGLAYPSAASRAVYDSEPGLPRFDFRAELTALLHAVMRAP